ncbi:MAG TPA: mechanosensitive ion channel family protein [Candidatus Binatia bacterium]|nr:mechanosensitive ion channel family protein [Candidatus Binatia bacterium]
MWSQDLLLIGQTVLVFLGLSFLYWIVFKRVWWRSSFTQALTGRIRLGAYLLIPLVTFVWVMHGLALLPHAYLHPPQGLVWVLQYVLLTVIVVLLVEACGVFVFDYLFGIQRQTDVPHILRSLARGVVYISLFFVFFPRIFGWQDIAGLLTSSAIVSIILGLALQETLGNLFAGIAMQMSRPYTAGHWVKIGAYEGVVEQADWRSMTIHTLNGDRVSFPHSLVAKMEVHNYSLPSPLHARIVQVGAHYRHPPARIEEILLRCTRETVGVCSQPPPDVRLSAYQDFSILYTVKFWIDDFAHYPTIESNVLKRVWYHFKRERIEIPFPIREVYHHGEEPLTDALADNVHRLKDIEFLQILTDEQLRELARRLQTQVFAPGETICRQGEAGETFYIIKNGQVEVSMHNGRERATPIRTIGAGDFFGEISLLTGEPRSATVTALKETEVLVMNKEDMRHMLAANDQLAEHISQVLAQRQQQLYEHHALRAQFEAQNAEAQKQRVESLRSEFSARIRSFFSY